MATATCAIDAAAGSTVGSGGGGGGVVRGAVKRRNRGLDACSGQGKRRKRVTNYAVSGWYAQLEPTLDSVRLSLPPF